VPQENMQSNSRMRKLKSNADWVIALDYGAVGLTASSLAMLVIQLVFAEDPYRRGHSIWLVAALVGFVVHVCTSRILTSRGRRCSAKEANQTTRRSARRGVVENSLTEPTL